MAVETPNTGYRHLSEEERQLINMVKAKANDMDAFICALELRDHTGSRPLGVLEGAREMPLEGSIDLRQLALARTLFEDAFMRLNRSIAQPRSM